MYINYIYDIILILISHKQKIMNEHIIKIPCRISELLPEHQVVIIRLINHLASSGDKYKDNVIKRLDDITLENCLTFFEDKN